MNIVLNNSVLIDAKKMNETNQIEYLTSSSDEKCLINFARYCGYTFTNRSIDNIITMEKIEKGKYIKYNYKICNILEFSSERQRMSVIINSKDFRGNDCYLLYIKGSDYMINKKVINKNTDIYKNIFNKVNEYSQRGLRILVFGYKTISEEEYNRFNNKYKEIIYDIHHTENDLYNLYDEIENNIELIGATAIEDQLQYDVENTIYKFVSIGIKVCMLTGDKTETAKKIASNCNLISKDMNFIDLTQSFDSIQQLENDLNQKYTELYPDFFNNKKNCLIITGEVLFQITSEKMTMNIIFRLL